LDAVHLRSAQECFARTLQDRARRVSCCDVVNGTSRDNFAAIIHRLHDDDLLRN
jgi:hypothetical protein